MTLVMTDEYKKRIEGMDCLRRSPDSQSDSFKRLFGTQFELEVAHSLLPLSNIFCYHQFKGCYLNKRFEADILLVVPSDYLLVVEVKAYKGNYSLSSDARYFEKIDLNGQYMKVKNPIPQITRTAGLLNGFLKKYDFSFNLVHLVVFSDGFNMSSAIVKAFDAAKVALLHKELFFQFLTRYTQGPFKKTSQSAKLVRTLHFTLGQSPILFDKECFS